MIVSILSPKKSPTSDFIALLDDSSISNVYPTIEDYFEKNGITYNRKDLKFLVHQLESYIEESLRMSAIAKFRKMTVSNEWGNAGEEQVRTSFLRCILNLSPDEVVTPQNVSTFNVEINKAYEEWGIYNASLEELERLSSRFKFLVFNKTYTHLNWQELTALLRFLGSKKGLLMTSFGLDSQFIFGEVKIKQIGLHKATYFLNEIIRSPNIIVPKVAVSQDAEIFIRYEGLKCVFHQKWVPVLSSEETWLLRMPERNISEGIKRKVLSYYGTTNPEETAAIEKQFVNDMCETIVFHELGHIVSRHDVLDEKIAAITEGTQVFSYAITMSLFELLADFAPQVGKIKGPLTNIVDISKKDVKRAEAMFYMYLSDVWFYDTYDEYMFIYSDLMVLALLRYINDDQSINFKKLEHDIYFKKSESDDLKDDSRFVNYLYNLLTTSIIRIQDFVKKVEFSMDGVTYNFDQMKAMIEIQFIKNGTKFEPHDYFYIASLWSFLFRCVEKLSASHKGLLTLLDVEKHAILKKFYSASGGKDAQKTFGTDYRGYIFSRMTAVGLVASYDRDKPIDI